MENMHEERSGENEKRLKENNKNYTNSTIDRGIVLNRIYDWFKGYLLRQ